MLNKFGRERHFKRVIWKDGYLYSRYNNVRKIGWKQRPPVDETGVIPSAVSTALSPSLMATADAKQTGEQGESS